MEERDDECHTVKLKIPCKTLAFNRAIKFLVKWRATTILIAFEKLLSARWRRDSGEDYGHEESDNMKFVNLCQFLIYNLITF